MATIYLGGYNASSLTNYGHLLLILVGDDGSVESLEVIPDPLFPVSDYTIRVQINADPSLSLEKKLSDTGAVVVAPLDLGERDANEVWRIISQYVTNIDDENFTYLISSRNSNSFIGSILNMIDVDVISSVNSLPADPALMAGELAPQFRTVR